jgi:hypothetical protein
MLRRASSLFGDGFSAVGCQSICDRRDGLRSDLPDGDLYRASTLCTSLWLSTAPLDRCSTLLRFPPYRPVGRWKSAWHLDANLSLDCDLAPLAISASQPTDLAKTLTALVLLGVVTLIVLRLSNVISLRAVVKHYVAANAAFSFSEGLGVAPSDGGCHKMRSMSALRSPDQFSALASGIGGRRAPCVLGPCGCLPSGCMAWLDCLL